MWHTADIYLTHWRSISSPSKQKVHRLPSPDERGRSDGRRLREASPTPGMSLESEGWNGTGGVYVGCKNFARHNEYFMECQKSFIGCQKGFSDSNKKLIT